MEHDDQSLMHAARFSFFALGFVLFGWFSYFLAIAGFFSPRILGIFGALMIFGAFRAARKWLGQETGWIPKIAFVVAATLPAVLLSFAEPTIFSGRDQGSISEAAIELSKTGGLEFSSPAAETFSAIYGEGKALNFPGFFYTEEGSLKTQFPLGYIAWLGAFSAFFGEDGFRVANALLLSLALLSIFFLVRVFSGERYALGAMLVAIFSFLPSWFAKFTLTENYALFLFLFLSLNLTLFLRENRVSFFLGSYFSAILLAVTRIEGLWVVAAAFAVLFFSRKGREFTAPRVRLFRDAPIAFAVGVLLVNFAINLPFYVVMAKAFLKNFSSIVSVTAPALADSAGISVALWKLFAAYGLLPVFVLGFAGIAILIAKKRFDALVPVLLALPTFLYFVDPNITHDHPWMLRRFLPVVFPTLLFTAAVAMPIALERWKGYSEKIAAAVFLAVVAVGFPAFIQTAGFADNRGLAETTGQIAEFVGERDLLLVDRESTGDPFSIPAGPLRFIYGKNAVYFFNPEDYAKIPKDRFEHIYLLAPLETFDLWKETSVRLEFVSLFSFSTKQLETLPLRDSRLPDRKTVEQDAALFELKPL